MPFFPVLYFASGAIEPGYVGELSSAPDRIYSQYRNKPKAYAWYRIATSLASEIGSTANQIRQSYKIDFASGDQLDVIGRIVVAPRTFLDRVSMSPGLFALTDGDEFGDEGAMFSALTISQDTLLSNELYRLVIRAKIAKNNSDASIDGILKSINFLLPGANVIRVNDGENMGFSIEFSGQISNLERYALLNAGLVPKPQGVRFNGFLEAFGMAEFGDIHAEFGDNDAEFAGFIGV